MDKKTQMLKLLHEYSANAGVPAEEVEAALAGADEEELVATGLLLLVTQIQKQAREAAQRAEAIVTLCQVFREGLEPQTANAQ